MRKYGIRICFTLLPLLYMLFIWMQSSYFNPESIYLLTHKINWYVLLVMGGSFEFAHLFQFGLLYLFIVMAFLSYGTLDRSKEIAAFLISLLFSISDEIHQIYVPYRSFSVLDLLKNLIGILVFSYLIHNHYFVKKRSVFGRKLKNITINSN